MYPTTEASFVYLFMPSEMFNSRSFGFTLNVYYKDLVRICTLCDNNMLILYDAILFLVDKDLTKHTAQWKIFEFSKIKILKSEVATFFRFIFTEISTIFPSKISCCSKCLDILSYVRILLLCTATLSNYRMKMSSWTLCSMIQLILLRLMKDLITTRQLHPPSCDCS